MVNEKRLESAARSAVRQRNYRRARERALTKLANAYPDQYKDLLESEKLNDEILGKKWTDLDGNTTSIPSSLISGDSTTSRGKVGAGTKENEGNRI